MPQFYDPNQQRMLMQQMFQGPNGQGMPAPAGQGGIGEGLPLQPGFEGPDNAAPGIGQGAPGVQGLPPGMTDPMNLPGGPGMGRPMPGEAGQPTPFRPMPGGAMVDGGAGMGGGDVARIPLQQQQMEEQDPQARQRLIEALMQAAQSRGLPGGMF